MSDFNPTKYKNDFQKEKYDRIIVNVPKGKRVEIDNYRKSKHFTSLNAYINELIEKDMRSSSKTIIVENIMQDGDNNSVNIQ